MRKTRIKRNGNSLRVYCVQKWCNGILSDKELTKKILRLLVSIPRYCCCPCIVLIAFIELALAPAALQALQGAECMYAEMLTTPFFHSGMVNFPPSGVKRIKNSRKNHMVFCVFYGRVSVNVAGTEFSIGRGGMWQVPRGKLMGISYFES
jgi:hypothetical protein